jgi:hypothetical protein
VWVTARGSNALLAFSATKLRSSPAHAFLAGVRVGQAPVGFALVDGGRRIIVADSNRGAVPGAASGLAIVDTDAALHHRHAILGTVPAGLFPREVSLEPNGNVVLITNFTSGQLEALESDQFP